MYRYTESGLRGIQLQNGYTIKKTPYGKAVSIVDVEGLHKAIGRALARKSHLTGAELRFLRKELGWSQHALAQVVGVSEQSVSLWERHGRVPAAADRLVRAIYLERVDGRVAIRELVARIADFDRKIGEERLTFERNRGWRAAA